MAALERPDPAFPEDEADRRLAADRGDLEAMLAKADNRMREGDLRAANAFYVGVTRLAGQGSALAAHEIQRAHAAVAWLADRFREILLEQLENAGFPREARAPRFQKSLEIMLGQRQRDPEHRQYPQLPLTYFYPDTDYCDFAEAGRLEWADRLRAATPVIRDEALALLKDGATFRHYAERDTPQPHGDVHALLGASNWTTYDLTERGEPIPERTARCPRTWRAVSENAPLCRIDGRAPTVMFSLLEAGSRIPPHTGMLNVRLICHLPLVVPPGCGFRVGNRRREWREGELMVFDDTVEHEAWNEGQSSRLLLIFDIWRPELEADERRQIEALFRAVDAA